MENKKIKQIEILLRKDNVSELDIKKRLKIFENLSSKVSKLMKEDPKFKGLEIFGSLLNEYFNSNSDIDVNFLLKDDSLYDRTCSCHKIYYSHIKDILGGFRFTKLDINLFNSLVEEDIYNLTNFDDLYVVQKISIPFGVFLGDENYRIEIARKIIDQVKKKKLVDQWPRVISKFVEFNRIDLTNPEENYGLSSFEKLIRDYKIN